MLKLRKLLLFFLIAILFIPVKSYGIENQPKVYLIIMNKLTIDDIKSMVNLEQIVNDGSIGLMNTRGISGYTGAESFLTINSSRKSSANYNAVDFQNRDNNIVNISNSLLINLNKNNPYTPYIGAIGDNLGKNRLQTGIYGNSDLINMPLRASALIPMNSRGIVDFGNIEDITIEDKYYPFGLRTDFDKLLLEILNSPADLIVVDTGDLERIYRYRENLSDVEYNNYRDKILSNLDEFINALANNIDKDNSLLIITSPNSGDVNVNNSKLSPIIIWGKSIEKGILTSSTTNRNMVVSNLDIGPTIMGFFESPMDNMSGNPMKVVKKNIQLTDLIKENQRINIASIVRHNTLYVYGIYSVIVLLMSIILLLTQIRLTEAMEEFVKLLYLLVLIIPFIFIIESLFKPSDIYGFVSIIFIFIFLSSFLLWITKKTSNQILYIGMLTIFIILLDLILKGNISRYSVLSHDPIIGARYYGIGNEMVGLLLGSVTIVSIKILEKKPRSLIPLFIFIISGILTSYPSYGANVGGSIAFAIATIFFIIEFYDKKLSLKRIILMVILIIAILSIIGYIDIMFNKNMTHLGKTILLIKNKNIDIFSKIIFRKILMNIKLVGRSFWTYLLLLHMILHALIFNFEKVNKNVSIGFMAGIAGAIGGFLFNDSGLILASICMNIITVELYLDYIKNKVK